MVLVMKKICSCFYSDQIIKHRLLSHFHPTQVKKFHFRFLSGWPVQKKTPNLLFHDVMLKTGKRNSHKEPIVKH